MILIDEAHLAALCRQLSTPLVDQLDTTEGDRTRVGPKPAAQKPQETGLTGPAGTNNGCALASRNTEIQRLYDTPTPIAQAHLGQLYGSPIIDDSSHHL